LPRLEGGYGRLEGIIDAVAINILAKLVRIKSAVVVLA
jgi:hypothetical protein